MSSRYTRSAGVTLVELVVALVIMGVALAGVVAVYASTTRASVDPVIVQQMQAIADNMMEEILLKPYAPGPAAGAGAGGARVNFDDVRDYNSYGQGIRGIQVFRFHFYNNHTPEHLPYLVFISIAIAGNRLFYFFRTILSYRQTSADSCLMAEISRQFD